MDNLKLGSFIAQLRKEKNMTQKELADRLHVTDKAVSKWETGKGFPDLKLMEPLAEVLGVSLVELLQGERQQSDTMTAEQAETVVRQAMDQSERTTARKYLKLFRWVLTGIGVCCTPWLYSEFWYLITMVHYKGATEIIGGADGPTAILTVSQTIPHWVCGMIPAVILVLCIVLAVKVWRLEKKLK